LHLSAAVGIKRLIYKKAKMTDNKKTTIDRMLERPPTRWGRNKDWQEGVMKAEIKAEIKKKIVERQK